MLSSLFHLFYPDLCAACGHHLFRHESVICLRCAMQLPRTGYHLQPGNEVEKVFWGRFPLHSATSFLFFRKGSRVQRLLHQLKYNGAREVGEHLGIELGKELLESDTFRNADLVIPVPLHPSKQRLRGFNQSEAFAKGLADSMGNSVMLSNLERITKTETQTRKHRSERWKNVGTAFHVNDPSLLRDKHILLVDDVLTTGATLEACAQALFRACDTISLSIATIAYARV